MTSIDFYGGVDEIGGNKIQISSNNNSFFFDFGKSFNKEGKFFSEFLQPRKANGIMDLMEFGLLPKVKGIYREDYLRHSGINFNEKPSVEGILISHAHIDHMGYLHHIRDDIPFYMSKESYLIIKSLETTGAPGFSNYINYKQDFLLIEKKRVKEGSSTHKRATSRDTLKPREIKLIEPYKTFEIGEFKIRSAPVDHSLPGSCAFLADDGQEALVYTGDFRFHGKREHETKKFVNEAKKFAPEVLITEGTRIDNDHNQLETDIERKAAELAMAHGDLIIVNYPIRDLDRFYTFYNVAKESDRTLVVNTKQAFLLNEFHGMGYPMIDDVAVYTPKKSWGLTGEDSYVAFGDKWISSSKLDPEYVSADYKGWEKDFVSWDNNVSYKDLKENPDEYIFQCDFFEFKELIDIKPKNAIYIKSKTEPFNDEMELDKERELKWLKHFNIKVHEGYHASGHACGPEIIEIIREINPESVYPIHTEKKEKFNVLKADGINVLNPKLSK